MSYIHGKSLIRIAVVDDHVLLRETCKVVMQAGNGKEFLDMLDHCNLPDLVLMDLNMPEMNGYDTIKILLEKFPDLRIMVVSMYQSKDVILRLINLGASGFFNKCGHPNEFKKAVHEMMREEYYFSDQSAARLMKQNLSSKKHIIQAELCEEELTFLKLITTDKTYEEIADVMKIKPRHAEYIRDKLFERFDVNSRISLACLVMHKGLVV